MSQQHHFINHIYNEETGKKETIETLLKGKDGPLWDKANSNEWGRLARGNKYGIKFTNTIDFIPKSEVPPDRAVTYANFVCNYRPLKSEMYRVRVVVGGDRLPYDDDAASPAASLIETKILLNSVISDHATHNSKFFSADLKDFFLASPMCLLTNLSERCTA